MDGFETFIRTAVIVLVPMILSLAVHEYAHAMAASWLGDDTAKTEGRLTLNPLSHIDPLGTLILPLLSVFASTAGGAGVPFFGWAKPVPYNPLRFRRTIPMRLGTVAVAAAGPLSNLVFALLCTAGLAVWFRVSPTDFLPGALNPGVDLLMKTMQINVALFFFNLLPLPPLDGSRVLANLLPRRYDSFFQQLERYSFFLFLMMFLVPGVFRVLAYPAILLIGQLQRIVFG